MFDQSEEQDGMMSAFASKHKCGHLPELASERYLMSENRSRPKSISGCDKALAPEIVQTKEQEELFHVLVTKPEIAGKPRDHVIFEGDMDLKTTFETTYEALAKLRLANWKRYQELRSTEAPIAYYSSPETAAIVNSKEQQMSQSMPDNNDHNKQQEIPCRGLIEQQQDVSFHQQPLSNKVSPLQSEGNHKLEEGVPELEGSSAPRHLACGDCNCELSSLRNNNNYNNNMASPPTITTTNNNNNNNSANAAATYAKSDSRSINVDLKTAAAATGKCPLHSTMKNPNQPSFELQPINLSSGQQQYNRDCSSSNNSYSNSYVDPDLSIIVYDANLNRLERLGVRKRSKYRPSTSLRPGTKGFFGNQQEHSPRSSEQVKQVREVQTIVDTDCTLSGRDTQTTLSITPQSQQVCKSKENKELSRSELAMSARNLMSSRQGIDLLYSNQNLPVDSKRRCRNNVNMVDHIKEQNIVEHQLERLVTKADPVNLLTCSCENSAEVVEQPQQQMVELDDEEVNNIAEQEEAAAVQEIQKITSNPLDDEPSEDAKPIEYERDAESRADDAMRRSRLRRTCQNQNFDIYNNDYRDTSVGRDGASNLELGVKKPSTRMSPSSTNLFKESSSAFC